MNFDELNARVSAGEPLTAEEVQALAGAPDILPTGMLADTLKRRFHGDRVTYLRVAMRPLDAGASDVPPAAREIRLTGSPATLASAVEAVTAAAAVAGARTVSAWSWLDVERVAAGVGVARALTELRAAGLWSLAELPLDIVAEPAAALDALGAAGFTSVRLTIDKGHAADRVALLIRAGQLAARFPGVRAINPLPMTLNAFRPTTGYDDVKMVALARLAVPGGRSIQVDWQRYGPKLAQVALSFGADDLDGVSGSDDAPEGRRRAPLEEIRRNIEAAGCRPIERDGRYAPLG